MPFDYRPDQGMADLDCEGIEHDVRSGASAVRFGHEPFEQVRESLGRTEEGPAKYHGFLPGVEAVVFLKKTSADHDPDVLRRRAFVWRQDHSSLCDYCTKR